jgi:hypothetical protein
MTEPWDVPIGALSVVKLAQIFRFPLHTPWAVLLCKFADDTSAPPPREQYLPLFTDVQGRAPFNMIDFFWDMSHRKIDLHGSNVFGWYTLPAKRSDYSFNVPGSTKLSRYQLWDLCRKTAAGAGVDFSKFPGVLVLMNGQVDLFGLLGWMGAFCDTTNAEPSLLGQEMGHGYGLDHARRDGSIEDYKDPYDVMSTANAFMTNTPSYGRIGPGLNAAAMRSRGWLDERRVWSKPDVAIHERVELRPLHRTDLWGNLAIELGEFLVEYRQKERWDAAFPRSCVLIHRMIDNHSYVMAGENGQLDLGWGDRFSHGVRGNLFQRYASVEVVRIDESLDRAIVSLEYSPGVFQTRPGVGQVLSIAGIILGTKQATGRGGRVADRMQRQIEAYLATDRLEDHEERAAARQAALSGLAMQALSQLATEPPLPPTETPPLEQDIEQSDSAQASTSRDVP